VSAPLLQARGLRAFYGAQEALHGVDFEVASGGVTALLGANGAGKTTTLRAIGGDLRREGEIRLAGELLPMRGVEAIARLGVAHAPEGGGGFAQMTVEENLRLGAYLRRDRGGVRRDFARVYGYFPRLAERRRQPAGSLSGGERQMLAIGRALMLRPRLMLLDEPSLGLAPPAVADIFRILREINRNEGVGLLLVEQNAGLALDLADRACLLDAGAVAASGAAQDIRAHAAVRRAYLGG